MSTFFQTFAKVFGFLLAIVIFAIFLSIFANLIGNNERYFSHFEGNKSSDEKIAIINIEGPIISEPLNIKNFQIFNSLAVIYPTLIKKYLDELEKEKILGLIVSINSSGGSVSASDEIYKLFKKFKNNNKIPIYFHTTDILASGGYWVALSGDKIFANYGALIGSIGVKGPDWLYYNSPTAFSSGLLGGSVESQKGIQLFSNSAGISKDIFNPFRAPSKKETVQLQQMVNDIYNDFVNLVSSNRKLENKIIKNKIGAMIFNTKQAKENYLIDSEKNIQEIVNTLTKELDLKSRKIITNTQNKSYNFFNLNILKTNSNKILEKKFNIYIKNKFCDNLTNELSSVAIKNNILKC